MSGKYSTIDWQENMNGVTIDCSLDIAVHPSESKVVFLTVPGVDGSLDGYEDKYVRIADSIQEQHKVAVVRIANPFITSHHWESNIRQALEYINAHSKEIAGEEAVDIRIMAHSAGAAVVAQIAWEYPNIEKILLINPATKLGIEKMKRGLADFAGNKITVVFGGEDPSVGDAEELSKADQSARMRTFVYDGVDHNFSGDGLTLFMNEPHAHLFNQEDYL